MVLDKRRVQAAVIGDAESESPVVLPPDATELDEFRRLHAGDTYWCGIWLGGCGQQLTTKLYTDRACHFAHHPHTSTASKCRRKASGVSSADHLYIKQHMLRWFAEQDIAVTADIARATDGAVGSSVVFTSEDGAGLRVLLSGEQPGELLRQAASRVLVAEDLAEDLTEGLDGPLARHGYLNVIRCVPDGTHRRVQIGTRTHQGVTWFDLGESQLTPEGLSTPTVEEVRRLRATLRPLGARPQKGDVPAARRPVIEHAATDPRSEFDRTAVMSDLEQAVAECRSLTKLRLCLERAEAATRNGATAGENALMRSAGDALLRLERGVGVRPSPVTQPATKRLSRPRAGTSAPKIVVPKLRIGPVGDVVEPPPRQKRPSAEELQAKEQAAEAARLQAIAEESRAHAAKLKQCADAVRGALKKAAREQATSSWTKLRNRLGSALPRLHPGDQAEILYQVDRDTPPDEPLLSTVLAISDPGVLPAFRKAAARLGLDLPNDADDLQDVLEADVQALHDLWRRR